MTPDDFKHTLLDEARFILESSITINKNNVELDPQTMQWVMRERAWMELLRQADYSDAVDVTRKRLLGISVRITIDDLDTVPAIQLLMEPMLQARR